jgi:hypothetical protein
LLGGDRHLAGGGQGYGHLERDSLESRHGPLEAWGGSSHRGNTGVTERKLRHCILLARTPATMDRGRRHRAPRSVARVTDA